MFKSKLIFTLLGCFLGAVLFHFLVQQSKDFDPQTAGLGTNTYWVQDKLRSIVLNPASPEELHHSYSILKKQGVQVDLLLGASQLHSINQYNESKNEHLAVYHLNQLLHKNGGTRSVLQMTYPNANLHELLAYYYYFHVQKVKFNKIVLALVYDDLSEDGVKNFVFDFLPQISKEDSKKFGEGLGHLQTAQVEYKDKKKTEYTLHQKKENVETTPELLEAFFVNKLEKIWPAYAFKDRVQAKMQFDVYSFFHHLMGFFAKRRGPAVSDYLENWNFKALESLVSLCKVDGVELIIYRQPHRPGEEPFYHDRHLYDSFYKRVQLLADQEHVKVIDLETIVPQKYWGFTGWRMPDVFHFQEQAHQILADKLFEKIYAVGGHGF